MRIFVCDYSGHPFQVQLSRELARRGNTVVHSYFSDFQTPKGRLQVEPGDPQGLEIAPLSFGKPFKKYGLVKRRFQEVRVGKALAERIATFKPDVVIGCNLPIDALDKVVGLCARKAYPFIFWQQDIYSKAIQDLLGARLGIAGRLIGRYYQFLERCAANRSSAVVVIADDFRETLEKEFGVRGDRIHTVENWAPLDEIAPRPKSNEWARSQGLSDCDVVLYTGTIGLKHDPKLILEAAKSLAGRPRTRIVVTSEGPHASWLAQEAKSIPGEPLLVLPFQAFEHYSDVLGAADVLIAVLERDAGTFSVPSKVLSYLCSGRPIVLSAPLENLAARIVTRANAGYAVAVEDIPSFVGAIHGLLDSPEKRTTLGANGRAFAESTFDIAKIADRFGAIISSVQASN
ncbi:glycosyltransferase family 4 protein [Bradyrhizobium sp. INPA01-394B]|uniref:Glycosyltransferase family 4 protein n=1 Tax=Bradyrhizobium campsiandrae TaxID=1729892 RepID=A0ABR7U9J7_9BRAD|nr:glycosyltransferase family 4 protein [Bradyrhizobium campsiandrae]MBC9879329.1 glycosyltransferase family 4 protein [Bradyrhizobium campsiandrae]MBC9980741.1 glycosyltransferase family 4 protein [Bradyrhizobium campsiandrae]